MKIKSLKLTDFKGFEELHIESFGKQTTAIIGNNGAGKSSVLEALNIMFYHLNGRIINIKDSIVNNNSKGQLASIELESKIGAKVINSKVKISKTDVLSSFEDKQQIEIFDSEIQKYKNETGNTYSIVDYPPSRIIIDYSDYDDLERIANSALDSRVDFRDFVIWFNRQENLENEKRLNENDKFRIRELEALRKAYRIFFPGFKKLRIKRGEKSKLIFENDDKILSFNQLSDGEKGVITLIGDIVRRLCSANPNLEDPLQGEAIIMIDEIELHLHPTWQRKIIKKLEAIFPNCQFIITTHSPQVLSELDAENDKIIAIKDFKAYEVPTVFGRETNWILETVMDTPARPSEFKNQLRAYFDLIAQDKLEEAETLRKKLEAQTGIDEPEFVKADMLIRRKKAMKK